ncbi:MAG: ParB/RepB/Spo0J family partition protein [Candidatus Omnitrophota bacterium]|jgi:ParB family chromosome partitioning protein|nr:MAG: ParB/RepB/Spo0J family partition protein [Candidatus Omnitrophota bacterium]
MKRKALGRGLSVLLADMPNEKKEQREIREISVDDIHFNQYQPRTFFDDDSLLELAESIQQHGILQPLLVRSHPEFSDRFQLIAGERRLRAAKIAEQKTIPCILLEAEEAQMLEIALIENIQRSDLNPVEEARAFKQLSDRFSLTQEEIAQRVGKSREAIANSLRLLNLPPSVLKSLENTEISIGHAKALLSIKDANQLEELANRVIREGLTVRQTEACAREETVSNPENSEKEFKEKDLHIRDLEFSIEETLQTKVNIKMKGKKKGIIEVHFYDFEHLEGLLRKWNVKLS